MTSWLDEAEEVPVTSKRASKSRSWLDEAEEVIPDQDFGDAKNNIPPKQPKPDDFRGKSLEAAGISALDSATLGLLPATLAAGDKLGLDFDYQTPTSELPETATFSERREYYRKKLAALQDQNLGASIAGGVVGAVPGALVAAPAGVAGVAGRVGQSAIQGFNSAEEGKRLDGALGGAALGLGGEAVGKTGSAVARGVGRGVRSMAAGDGALKALSTAVTGGNAKKQLEDKVIQYLIKQEESAAKAGERAYSNKARDIERAFRKEALAAPSIAARLSPEEKAAQSLTKAQSALESLKSQEKGMLGQYTLQDLGYIRDALFLSGGDPVAARAKLVGIVPEDSAAKVLGNFDELVARGDEKLVERLGKSPQERVAAEFEPKRAAAEAEAALRAKKLEAVKAIKSKPLDETEKEIAKRVEEAMKAYPKPSGVRPYEEIRKGLPEAIKNRMVTDRLAPHLAREVYDTVPGWMPKAVDKGANPLVRGGQVVGEEEDLGAQFIQWLKDRAEGIK